MNFISWIIVLINTDMIGYYIKKPVTVSAVKWTGDNIGEVKAFTDNKAMLKDGALIIPTLEGTMVANKGSYIIKGIKNELYPCREDIFEDTYDKVI